MECMSQYNLVYLRSPVEMQLSKNNKSSMRKPSLHKKYQVLTIFILLIGQTSFSQNDSAQQMSVYDSTKLSFDSATNKLYDNIKRFGDSARRKNLLEYRQDTIATKQDRTIELIKILTLEVQNYIENGLDTSGLTKEVNQIAHWYEVTGEGVFTNTSALQTHYNLETTYKILRELLIRITARKSLLDKYYKNLVDFRNRIDSLYNDDILYRFPSDTTDLKRYVERLTVVSQEIKPIDSALKKILINVAELQPPINLLANKLSSSIEQVEIFQKSLSSSRFNQESTNLWDTARYARSFNEIIRFSWRKTALSFVFYVSNEAGKIFLLLLLIIVFTALLLNLRRNMLNLDLLDKNNPDQAVLKYPFLSALFIVLNVFQFVFIDPPFIFAGLIWVLSAVSLSVILKNVAARYWWAAWLILFILFLFACFDNLILQASRPERWGMVGLSIAGILSAAIIIKGRNRTELTAKFFSYLIGFLVIMQVASILTNVYGRYNLSKTFLTAGFFSVVLAVLFFWTLRFIGQTLTLSTRIYSKSDRRLFNANLEFSGNNAPVVFKVLLFAGWFILFSRNFYAYKFISEPVINFIIQKRTFGDNAISFTIGDILEFFLILYISGLVSRLISFLGSNQQIVQGSAGRKGGIANWLLIIRISIITIGLLAAFAALGIPMDRLTVILSALSVGVGFGLQNLVNNLVSGLIISFEKPVSVGDIVEVGGQTGTVKSIGFRSCIITTPGGSNMVIPNGELLDQHFVNWTHDNPSRTVDIDVGVPYGTNLEQAIKILKGLPEKDERILQDPPPSVIITQFNHGSIDMQLSFWVKDITDVDEIKTDIMLAIDLAFKEHSIKIPNYPPELPAVPFSKGEIHNKNGSA